MPFLSDVGLRVEPVIFVEPPCVPSPCGQCTGSPVALKVRSHIRLGFRV